MPALCDGFKDELIKSNDFLQKFKQLKNFRNTLIHGKISDALFAITFVEQKFFYSRSLTKPKDGVFPAHKVYLKIDDVINFAEKVEMLLDHIKEKMDDEHRELVETYFMKEQMIRYLA